MKQKTKSILAAVALVATPIAGLAGVGVGIWAFTQLPHPYINQWVDLVNEKYTPIVSQVSEEVIRQTLHLDPGEQLTDEKVQQFYCDKVTKTPEIFVEDFLKGEVQVATSCSENRVRVSDPTIRYNEQKKKYFLSFTWDQTVYFKEGEYEGSNAKWKVHFHNLTFSPKKVDRSWVLNFDLKNDKEWEGTWTFDYCTGFGDDDVWPTEASGKTFKYDTFEANIKDPFFYSCDFTSWYLGSLN